MCPKKHTSNDSVNTRVSQSPGWTDSCIHTMQEQCCSQDSWCPGKFFGLKNQPKARVLHGGLSCMNNDERKARRRGSCGGATAQRQLVCLTRPTMRETRLVAFLQVRKGPHYGPRRTVVLLSWALYRSIGDFFASSFRYIPLVFFVCWQDTGSRIRIIDYQRYLAHGNLVSASSIRADDITRGVTSWIHFAFQTHNANGISLLWIRVESWKLHVLDVGTRNVLTMSQF